MAAPNDDGNPLDRIEVCGAVCRVDANDAPHTAALSCRMCDRWFHPQCGGEQSAGSGARVPKFCPECQLDFDNMRQLAQCHREQEANFEALKREHAQLKERLDSIVVAATTGGALACTASAIGANVAQSPFPLLNQCKQEAVETSDMNHAPWDDQSNAVLRDSGQQGVMQNTNPPAPATARKQVGRSSAGCPLPEQQFTPTNYRPLQSTHHWSEPPTTAPSHQNGPSATSTFTPVQLCSSSPATSGRLISPVVPIALWAAKSTTTANHHHHQQLTPSSTPTTAFRPGMTTTSTIEQAGLTSTLTIQWPDRVHPPTGCPPRRSSTSVRSPSFSTSATKPLPCSIAMSIGASVTPRVAIAPINPNFDGTALTNHAMYTTSTSERNTDEYLYCEPCGKERTGTCRVHGPMKRITDAVVQASDPRKAYNSLPPGLSIRKSSLPGAGLGVWTKVDLARGILFGPYKGTEVAIDSPQALTSEYCWEICNRDRPSHCVDGKDEAEANWMRFVNCANNDEQQNLTALQYLGHIFYRTIKSIPPGNELLVWYGKEYSKVLGLDSSRSPEPTINTSFGNRHVALPQFTGVPEAESMVTEDVAPSPQFISGDLRTRDDEQETDDPPLVVPVEDDQANVAESGSPLSSSSSSMSCDACSASIVSNDIRQLRRHQRDHHRLRVAYVCKTCALELITRSDVQSHQTASGHHDFVQHYVCIVFVCDECPREFVLYRNLMSHHTAFGHGGYERKMIGASGELVATDLGTSPKVVPNRGGTSQLAQVVLASASPTANSTRQIHSNRQHGTANPLASSSAVAAHQNRLELPVAELKRDPEASEPRDSPTLDEENPAEELQCHLCKEVVRGEGNLARHIKTKHQNLLCKLCKQYFKSAGKLQTHMLSFHSNHQRLTPRSCKKYTFRCDSCSMLFASEDDVRIHRLSTPRCQTVLPDDENGAGTSSAGIKLRCQLCKNEFALERDLRKHMTTKHPAKRGRPKRKVSETEPNVRPKRRKPPPPPSNSKKVKAESPPSNGDEQESSSEQATELSEQSPGSSVTDQRQVSRTKPVDPLKTDPKLLLKVFVRLERLSSSILDSYSGKLGSVERDENLPSQTRKRGCELSAEKRRSLRRRVSAKSVSETEEESVSEESITPPSPGPARGKRALQHRCYRCNLRFSASTELADHQRDVHRIRVIWTCSVCQLEFAFYHEAREHQAESLHRGIDRKDVAAKPKTKRQHRSDTESDSDNAQQTNEDQPGGGTPIQLPKLHNCSMCHLSYTHLFNLKIHQRLKHRKNDTVVTCVECHEAFDDFERLKSHQSLTKHLGSSLSLAEKREISRYRTVITCDACKQTFHELIEFERHQSERDHTGKIVTLQPPDDTLIRGNQVTGNERYACYLCNETFTRAGLTQHRITAHQMLTNYTCLDCMTEFCSAADYTKHRSQSKHVARMITLVGADQKAQLLTEQLQPLNEDGHRSSATCQSTQELAESVSQPTIGGDTHYECFECHMDFQQPINLRRHQAQVHRLRQFFTCMACKWGFDELDDLLQHQSRRKHTLGMSCSFIGPDGCPVPTRSQPPLSAPSGEVDESGNPVLFEEGQTKISESKQLLQADCNPLNMDSSSDRRCDVHTNGNELHICDLPDNASLQSAPDDCCEACGQIFADGVRGLRAHQTTVHRMRAVYKCADCTESASFHSYQSFLEHQSECSHYGLLIRMVDKRERETVVSGEVVKNVVDSEAAAPDVVDSETAAPKVVQNKVAAPEVADSKAAAPKVVNSKAAAPKVVESKVAVLEVVDSKAAATKVAKCKAAAPKVVDSKASPTKVAASEAIVPEVSLPPTSDVAEVEPRSPTQLQCRFCGRPFPKVRYMKKHMQNVHKVLIVYGCRVCGKEFDECPVLREHQSQSGHAGKSITLIGPRTAGSQTRMPPKKSNAARSLKSGETPGTVVARLSDLCRKACPLPVPVAKTPIEPSSLILTGPRLRRPKRPPSSCASLSSSPSPSPSRSLPSTPSSTPPPKKRPHGCQECDAAFASFSGLRRHHFRRHGNRLVITCCACGQEFEDQQALVKHQRIREHKKWEKAFVGPDGHVWPVLVETKSRGRPILAKVGKRSKKVNGGIATAEEPTTASESADRLRANAVLRPYRSATKTSPKKNQCHICDMVYERWERLRHHLLYVHDFLLVNTSETPDTLNNAVAGSKDNSDAAAKAFPEQPITLEEGNYLCHLCGAKCLKYAHMKDHLSSAHGVFIRHSCSICLMRFSTTLELRNHQTELGHIDGSVSIVEADSESDSAGEEVPRSDDSERLSADHRGSATADKTDSSALPKRENSFASNPETCRPSSSDDQGVIGSKTKTVRPFSCLICSAVLHEFAALTEHLRSEHKVEGIFCICNSCQLHFETYDLVKKHHDEAKHAGVTLGQLITTEDGLENSQVDLKAAQDDPKAAQDNPEAAQDDPKTAQDDPEASLDDQPPVIDDNCGPNPVQPPPPTLDKQDHAQAAATVVPTDAAGKRVCIICGLTFDTLLSLRIHHNRQHDISSSLFTCECGLEFDGIRDLPAHQADTGHTGIERTLIGSADEHPALGDVLGAEATESVAKPETFACDVCDFKDFACYSHLIEHRMNWHNIPGLFGCHTCGVKFESNLHLTRHHQEMGHEGVSETLAESEVPTVPTTSNEQSTPSSVQESESSPEMTEHLSEKGNVGADEIPVASNVNGEQIASDSSASSGEIDSVAVADATDSQQDTEVAMMHSCQLCFDLFDSVPKLREHHLVVHNLRTIFVCGECQHATVTEVELQLHLAESEHGDGYAYLIHPSAISEPEPGTEEEVTSGTTALDADALVELEVRADGEISVGSTVVPDTDIVDSGEIKGDECVNEAKERVVDIGDAPATLAALDNKINDQTAVCYEKGPRYCEPLLESQTVATPSGENPVRQAMARSMPLLQSDDEDV